LHLLLILAALAPAKEAPFAELPEFTLTERSGTKVTRRDFVGEVWVASFILTGCRNKQCPSVTKTVKRLHDELANRKGLRFVTFTVDPANDSPSVLAKYADDHGADPDRWLFLTGSEEQIEAIRKGFLESTGKDDKGVPDHSARLYLVRRDGGIIAAEDGMRDDRFPEQMFERGLLRLKRAIDQELKPPVPAWMPSDFPAFNALLNGIATVLLLVGYWAIRLKAVRLHVVCMLTTVAVSALFLASYLFYHIYVKAGRETRFHEQAPDAPTWMAWVYYAILISHVLLAVVSTPLALYTAWLGLRENWARHVAVARWTFPMWVYVSTTGVVVYWMLYKMYPPP
jgi:protein SCO1/2/putative membrane protein